MKQFVFECIELVDSFFARPHLVLSEFELWKLKKKYHIGIVTNRSKMFMETMLKRAEIKEGFFEVIGATRGLWNTWDNASRGWILIDPKPSLFLSQFPFLAFLKKHKIDLSEILFVGDDVSDYLSVKGTQVYFAGIACTEAQKKSFLNAGLSQEYIFENLKDALSYFGIC
ncbi:MAG: HAD family hydrolase [Parcubacteria group bacterium]|nr:HAD family hydrolase [Parcubacteria group bacterium]